MVIFIKEKTMKYNYVMEHEVQVVMQMSLYDIEQLLKILTPITEDSTLACYYEGRKLHRELSEIRESALSSAVASLQYEHGRVTDQKGK